MISYILRRLAYAVPILLGVNLLLFLLFFLVYSPDKMAKQILGEKVTDQRIIENWKKEHGYHLPRFYNAEEEQVVHRLTQTIFWQKSMRLFVFDFGTSDQNNSSISAELKRRIPFSLYLTLPMFILGITLNLFLSMIVAFYRGTYVDTVALFTCVIMMSISSLFYIIGGQYIFANQLRLVPVSGFDPHLLYTWKFLLLPIAIGVLADVGRGVRYYRTIFLEEINKDYIRTARAKGLGEGAVLFKHALKNAMLPILTNVVVMIPFLIMGNLLLEKFFGIPGLGTYMIDAIGKTDFSAIRAMVFLGSLLYVAGLMLVDISYTFVDPRVRLK